MQQSCAMGWLRDLMNLSEPPVPSFGRLADACLDHATWPEDADIKPRSLSTLFSKLDRSQDLDWLRDRPDVQRTVALILGRPVGDLRAGLGEQELAPDGRLLRLRDARYARELDLTREALPPGIPPEVLTPAVYGPTFWQAPSGSGRSLVGRWLRARGLAQVVMVRTQDDLGLIPARGALFLELARSTVFRADDILRLRLGERPVCIAAEVLPAFLDEREQSDHPRLSRVSSPPIEHYLSELIDWLEARLDGSGEFSTERAEQWMRRVALPHGAVKTLGDALGLLGMLDEQKPRSLHGRSLDEIAESYVKRRVREATIDTSFGPKISDTAFECLSFAAGHCLVSADGQLSETRSLDEWTELFSLRSGPGLADPEWLDRALKKNLGKKIASRDLRRATRDLPPGAYQLVRSFERSRLLTSESGAHPLDDRRLSLTPHWLVSVLEARAAAQALTFAPADWGAALLDPSKVASIEGGLFERLLLGDDSPIETLLDEYDENEISLVCALEATVVCSARADLFGRPISDDLCRELLRHAARSLVLISGELTPRVGRPPGPHLTDGQVRAPSFQSVYIASLAVLSRRVPSLPAHLDPHRAGSTSVRPQFVRALIDYAESLPALPAKNLLALTDELAPAGSPERPSALKALDYIQGSLRQGEAQGPAPLSFADARTKASLSAILLLSEGRLPKPSWARVWELVEALPEERQQAPALHPAADNLAFLDPSLRRRLWQNIPEAHLKVRLTRGAPISYVDLLPHHFSFLLAQAALPEAAIQHCPLDAALDALNERRENAFEPAALRALLKRDPDVVAGALADVLRKNRGQHCDLLLSAFEPESLPLALSHLPSTPELLTLSEAALNSLTAHFGRAITARAPGYDACFQRLSEITSALRPLEATRHSPRLEEDDLRR